MTFLEKYELLKKSIPVPALWTDSYTVNCEYADDTFRSKNCYYAFASFYIEDSLYTDICSWGKSIVDCHSVYESEKCYECVDSIKCHTCTYLLDCNNCTDSHFSALLVSCSYCFGCVGLTHKKYCIFNKQYTKEEYFKRVDQLKKEKPEAILKRMFNLKQRIPHPASMQSNNDNCPYGNYIYDSKNCYWSFWTLKNERSGYTFYSSREDNCWDSYCAGGTPDGTIGEKCYEIVGTEDCYNCAYLFNCDNCSNCFYSKDLRNCSDCFGCIGLTSKKYCILNNQLTKEQFEKTVKEIKKELGWRV